MQRCIHPPISWFYFYFLHLQINKSIFWHCKITSNHLQSENCENRWYTRYGEPGHSVDIISTCYVYENRRKWSSKTNSRECCRQVQNLIWFFFFRWSILTNYWKHFPQSICREFISPVCYYSLLLTKLGSGDGQSDWYGIKLICSFIQFGPDLWGVCVFVVIFVTFGGLALVSCTHCSVNNTH